MAIFDPLQNRHPLTDRQKIVTGDYVGDPYSCAKFGAYPTRQMRRWIFAHDSSNDTDWRKDVPFLGFVDSALHLGAKSPKIQNFGCVNRHFQAKLVK